MQTNPFASPRRATSSTTLPQSTKWSNTSDKLIKLICIQLGLNMSTSQEGNLGFLPHRASNQGNILTCHRVFTCTIASTIGGKRTCYLLIEGQCSATRPNELITFLLKLPKWNVGGPIDSCFNSKFFPHLSIRTDLEFSDATNASSHEVGHDHSVLWCN